MAYDIRLVKIITGELIIGKYNAEDKCLNDAAIVQTVPNKEGGMQLMLLPYGYPFEQTFCGSIAETHFLYTYSKKPQEMVDKYLETVTNLTLKSDGLDPNPSGIIL